MVRKLIEDSSYRSKITQNLNDLVKMYDSKEIALKWEKLLKKNK